MCRLIAFWLWLFAFALILALCELVFVLLALIDALVRMICCRLRICLGWFGRGVLHIFGFLFLGFAVVGLLFWVGFCIVNWFTRDLRLEGLL